MLTITIPPTELYSDATGFVEVKEQTLQLEHSLRSVAKWESKWKTNYLNNPNKSKESDLDYIRCMTIGGDSIDPNVFKCLTQTQLLQIQQYINDPMTATVISQYGPQKKKRQKKLTNELIYSYMVQLHIPFEADKWHLNRLLTLIEVCGISSSPENKMSKKDAARAQREINEARIAAKQHKHG